MASLASKVLSRGSMAEALLHLLALSVLFFLAVARLDFINGGLVCLVIGAAYLAWNALSARRAVTAASGKGNWLARALIGACFVLMHGVLGLIVAGIAIMPVIYVSTFFTRAFDIISILQSDISPMVVLGGVIYLLMAAGFAFFCVIAFESTGFEPWSATWQRIRKRWAAAALGQMLIALPAGLAFYGIIAAMAAGPSIAGMTSSMNLSWGQTSTSVLTGYPVLLYLLLGAAVALAPHRGLAFRYVDFIASVRHEGTGDGDRRRHANPVALIALLVIGTAAAGLGNAKLLRDGFVAAYSSVTAISYVFDADTAIRDWVTAAIDDGGGTESVAARLNEKGHWSSASPGQGLAELFPELGEKLAAMEDLTCTMAVVAGSLSAEERSAVSGLDSEVEPVAIKYCFKSVCGSPRVAEEDTVTWMFSSHPSKREGWSEIVTSDTLFGKIHAAGGFCTPAGELAEGYQG
jgi:hypothetical protein